MDKSHITKRQLFGVACAMCAMIIWTSRGKEESIDVILRHIPAGIATLLVGSCGFLLGERLEAGGTRASLWRRFADVVGSIGFMYLAVSIFEPADRATTTWKIGLLVALFVGMIGYKWSAEERQKARKEAEKEALVQETAAPVSTPASAPTQQVVNRP